jgi:histidinol-phosphate aminotransferase
LNSPPYVGGASKAQKATRTIKLSSNECALGPSPKGMAAYAALVEDLHRYPDGGCVDLRAALAEKYGIEAGRIVCGDGSDEVLYLMTRAYAGEGEEVLFSEHGFVVYRLASLGASATPMTSAEENFRPDIDAMRAAVTDRTRIVYLTNPNSTGAYIPASEVRRLHEGLRDDILLVIDAAYAEYVTAPDYDAGFELAREAGNVVVTRTFSKAYGLAGVRLGWCYGPDAVIDVLNRLRGPFNVAAPAQAAGIAALGDDDFLDAVVSHNEIWRSWLVVGLQGLGFNNIVPSVTNFILLGFADAVEADAAIRFMADRGVLVRDLKAYGLGDYVRITVGREEDCKAVVETLAEFRGPAARAQSAE